jgi:hypothetical protein
MRPFELLYNKRARRAEWRQRPTCLSLMLLEFPIPSCRHRDNVLWLGHGLNRGTMLRYEAQARDFSLLQSLHIVIGAHPLSYSMGTGTFPRGAEWPMREHDSLHPRSREVKNEWSCTYTPPICLHSVYRTQLHLLPTTVTTNRESDSLYNNNNNYYYYYYSGVPVSLMCHHNEDTSTQMQVKRRKFIT